MHDVSALQKEATSNEATIVEEAASNSVAATQEEDAQQQTSCFTCFTEHSKHSSPKYTIAGLTAEEEDN